VVDYVGKWTGRTEPRAKQLLGWIGKAPRDIEEARSIVGNFVTH